MRRYRLFEVTKLPTVITSSLRRVIRHEYTSLALYDHDHQGHAYARARLSPASSSRCFHDAAGSGRFFMPAIENSSMRSKEIPHNILVELAGGVAGAYYVMTVFTAVPLIGAATTVRLTIAGQQLVSMLVDRYGLLRLPQRPISTVRMASVFLLLTGVALIRVF